MKKFITIILLLLSITVSAQQDSTKSPEQYGLETLCEYLSLKPNDISFRSDYTEPDSFRLKIAADLMNQPLGMIDYADNLKKSYIKTQPELLAAYLYRDLLGEHQGRRQRSYKPTTDEVSRQYNLYYRDLTLNQLLTKASLYLDIIIPKSSQMMLKNLTKAQKKFLSNEFKELLVLHKEHELLPVEVLDSLDKVEEEYIEEFVTFAAKIDKDPLVDAGVKCLRDLMTEAKGLKKMLSKGKNSASDLLKQPDLPARVDMTSYLGKQKGWKVGSTGNDYYTGSYEFILDLGGDDVYDLSYDPSNPHGTIIIDMSGNDSYRSKTDFTIGSGCFSAGILIDFEGDDRYDAKSFGIGSGYFGFGILYDGGGSDIYNGDTHVQGCGSFGMGLLIDENGRDIYNSAVYSQGFGFVEGIGLIYESDGSDTYYAGGKYQDVLRYEDHYLSLSQGFGYGLRPWMSGGIGAIVDLAGNDNYNADIFAQGASYWWSLGLIYDIKGNDNYQCFQYGQGCGTHMTLGALIDDFGDDVYFGKGLMQGVGHDYSCGLMLDRHGSDTYTADDLSQGAGSANGAGLLIDNEGDDRYSVKSKKNTQGYGNPRRDFGSIGLFIDLNGTDQYQGNGRDNYFWKTPSKWGGGMDFSFDLVKKPKKESDEN